jgi:hypothetical protein
VFAQAGHTCPSTDPLRFQGLTYAHLTQAFHADEIDVVVQVRWHIKRAWCTI